MIEIISLNITQFRVWNKKESRFIDVNNLLMDTEGTLYEFDWLKGELLGELEPNVNEITTFTGETINDKKLYYSDIVCCVDKVGDYSYHLVNDSEALEGIMFMLPAMKNVFVAGNIYQNESLLGEKGTNL